MSISIFCGYTEYVHMVASVSGLELTKRVLDNILVEIR